MSTAHIYGDPPDVICDEDSSFGVGLAPFVGRAWEEAFHASVLPVTTASHSSHKFRDRPRSRRGLRRHWPSSVRWGPLRIRRPSRQRQARHELDSRARYEPLIRARADPMPPCKALTSPPRAEPPFLKRNSCGAMRQALHMPIGLPAFSWMGPPRRAAPSAHPIPT